MTHRPLWRGQPLDALLFDLDGTLLDTAGDITVALNRTLAEYGWAPAAQDEVRRMIGRGSPVLIQRTAARQGRALDEATQTAMVERFFHHYGGRAMRPPIALIAMLLVSARAFAAAQRNHAEGLELLALPAVSASGH